MIAGATDIAPRPPADASRRAGGWQWTIAVHQPALSFALFLCGMVAVQRFTLDPVNALICIIPFGLFVLKFLEGRRPEALSCLLLSLLLSVDNGGGTYAETPSPLRYLIYVTAIAVLFFLNRPRIAKKALVLAALLVIGLVLGALVSAAIGGGVFDWGTLRRDLLALFILSAFLLVRGAEQLDVQLVYAGSLGYLAGEVANALMFYNTFPDYMSYDSLKAFVVFPLIYSLIQRRHPLVQAALAAATLYVVFLYGSRMITLSIIVFFLSAFIISSVQRGRGRIIVAVLLAILLFSNIDLVAVLNSEKLVLMKALSFITVMLENFDASDIFQMFASLDPVRFAEHQLFFSRHTLQVLLGSGLGSGIIDAKGLLGFVTIDQTAFSIEEVRSSIFFNLHDFWIDYGLRFGLLPVAYLIYLLAFREMLQGRRWHGVLFGVLLLNTTFATSGLLLTSLVLKFFPRRVD